MNENANKKELSNRIDEISKLKAEVVALKADLETVASKEELREDAVQLALLASQTERNVS